MSTNGRHTYELSIPVEQEALSDALLAYLWRGGTFGYYWTPDGEPWVKDGVTHQSKPTYWTDAAQIKAPPATWWKKNLYFGVHPCRSKGIDPNRKATQQRAVVAIIEAINCIFSEFDGKDFVTPDEYAAYLPADFLDLPLDQQAESAGRAQAKAFTVAPEMYKARAWESIEAMPLAPSIVVDSGGGFHAYHLLTDPLQILDSNREHIANVQAAWVQLVGSDPNAKDLARVLRMPGSTNAKPAYGPNYPVVIIIHADFERQYSIEQFEVLTVDLRAQRRSHVASIGRTDNRQQSTEYEDAVDALRRLSAWRCDNYDEWLRVGFALKAGLGDAGLSLWEQWSQGSYKCKEGDCEYRWKRLKPNSITLATLIWRANEDNPKPHGYQYAGAYDGFGSDMPDPLDVPWLDAPAALPTFDALEYPPNQTGIVDAWRDLVGDRWLFIPSHEVWYQWQVTHWEKDSELQLQTQLEGIVREMIDQHQTAYREAKAAAKEAKDEDDTDALEAATAKANASAAAFELPKRLRQIINDVSVLARNRKSINASTLDGGNILSLSNGVLDLSTFELHQHTQTDYLTYVLDYPYDPTAVCPRFEQFLSEVLVKEEDERTHDPDMALLLQELWGYSLTRDTGQEVMAWLSGEGANGKTTMLTVLRSMLGPLATNIDFHTLGQPGNYDLADLVGKRIALSTESSRNSSIVDELIKKIASGETLKTRAIFGHPFEFKSTAKLWWAMNDKPQVHDTSRAFWRRLVLIPFYRSFDGDPNKDVHLLDKLLAERSGILNWAINGLMRLRRQGCFTKSESAQTALDAYKEEANPIAQWLKECTKASTGKLRADTLYTSYCAWCATNGRKPVNSTRFGLDMKRLGVPKDRSNGIVYYLEFLPTADPITGTADHKQRAANDFDAEPAHADASVADGL